MAAAIPSTVSGATPIDDAARSAQLANRGAHLQVVAQPGRPISTPVATVTQVFAAVNSARVRAGLAELQWNDKIAASTQVHADYLAKIHRTSHDGPTGDPGDRLRAAGYTARGWGETLSYGYLNAEDMVKAWLSSPGHEEILLGPFRDVGIARAKDGNAYVFVLVAANGS